MNTRSFLQLFVKGVVLGLAVLTCDAVAAPADIALDVSHASIRAVIEVQKRVTADLMAVDGVLGTAVGIEDDNQPSLVVFVDRDAKGGVAGAIPARIGLTKVRVELTDKFRALAGRPGGGGGGGISHTAKQNLPIKLGTSGGWRNDLANGFCCGGTLGSLIQVHGVQYILSNYHVFEADIISGGNGTFAATGDPVIHPGLIDIACNAGNGSNVATLVQLSALPSSNVDCSIAQALPGAVSSDGAILQIGALSSQTRAASLRLSVKKSGRTTGLTSSSITALNATIQVTYENECAGGTAFTKVFTGQLVMNNKGSKFLNGGDSGALLVENTSLNPRAVGLLFAGSSSTAIANPIDEVLAFVGTQLGGIATMVGN